VDSKSQSVPMLVRVGAAVCVIASWLALFALATASLRFNVSEVPWLTAALVGIVGSIGIMATFVGNASSGAVDNASGMVTVLLAASLLDRGDSVGVIVTDAEELGLAGARALVETWSTRPQIALNVDGVDDDGALLLMTHGVRSALPARVLRQVAARMPASGEGLSVRRTIPGVLVDSIAFVDAGWQSVTLSRGTARTLRRIHTRADGREQLRGVGIPRVARVLAEAARELT